MASIRISSKYQVVIPKEARQELRLRVGQDLQVVVKNGTLTLIPDRPVSSVRGIARGIRTSGFREKKDRL